MRQGPYTDTPGGVVSDTVGHPLAQARMLHHWSQNALAARVRAAGRHHGIPIATSKKTIARWEHDQVPDEPAQQLLAAVFDVDDDVRAQTPWPLWLPAPDLPELCRPWTAAGTVEALADALRSGHMDRRTFVVLSGVTLTTLLHDWLTAEPDIAHAATTDGRRVPGSMVDRIANRISDLQHDDDTHGGGDLIIEAQAHLALVHRLLDHGTYTQAQGTRLHAQAADLARMCGWMAFDTGRHAASQRYFAAALHAAHTSGDHLLGANVLAFAAVQHYSAGNPLDADAMVRTAQASVRGRSTPTVDAMLAARQGRALAKAGDARGCYHALNRATDLLDQGPSDDDPTWAYWVERPEIDMLTGSCMLDLGDPAAAQTKFREADAAYGPEYVRTHVLYLTRMATAQLQQHELDAACASAHQALDLAADLNSGRGADHVRDFATYLAPHRSTQPARDFLERVRTLAA